MKKQFSLLFFMLLSASVSVNAQNLSSAISGQNNFILLGNAEAKFVYDTATAKFTEVNFKPIFLWRITDKLFVESEVEIETGDGVVDIGLEYANMCYMVNKYMIIHAGRFLPKFGAYRG